MARSAHPPAGERAISEMKARIEAERAGLPFLLYRDGDGGQGLFSFEPGLEQASVGRGRSADLVLDWDEQVSRLHARFERGADHWAIVDDGLSRNGTFVNGERLSGRRRLSDGDDLRFGATAMTFRAPRAGEPPPPPGGGGAPATVDLSSTQRRVLLALCGRYRDGDPLDGPAVDQQMAEDLFLSPGAVRTHLMVLFAKFGVEALPAERKRIGVVERAIYAGVISDGDL